MSERFKTTEFGETIARLCYDFFNKLPKTGKPKSNEWTVLAGVVKSRGDQDLEVVALGTGSKCLGQGQMSAEGNILNDSHAEVLARRGFVRYLYEQIEFTTLNQPSVLLKTDEGKFTLTPDVHFHFFSSQTPCGDAAIITHDVDLINNTGAKCIDEDVDTSMDRVKPVLGQVRRKPGKGDPTLSVSCSDKIAKWIRVGFHGALLDTLLREPIFVKTITIGNDCAFSMESIERALFQRNIYGDEFLALRPEIHHSTATSFSFPKDPLKQPCDSSIIWSKVKERSLEIAVEGRKQGVTKKNINKNSSYLKVSKKCLYSKYMSILKLINSSDGNPDNLPFIFGDKTYQQMKQQSLRYYTKWSIVKKEFFRVWTEKPEYLNFTEI